MLEAEHGGKAMAGATKGVASTFIVLVTVGM